MITKGRTITYTDLNGIEHPAIVTSVLDGEVHAREGDVEPPVTLTVFLVGFTQAGKEPVYFAPQGSPGCWHWPPRV